MQFAGSWKIAKGLLTSFPAPNHLAGKKSIKNIFLRATYIVPKIWIFQAVEKIEEAGLTP